MTYPRNRLYLGSRVLLRTTHLRPIEDVVSGDDMGLGHEGGLLLEMRARPAELALGFAMHLVQEGCEGKDSAIEAAISAYQQLELQLQLTAGTTTSPMEWNRWGGGQYSDLIYHDVDTYVVRWVIGATAAQILKDQAKGVPVPRSIAGDKSILGLTEMARYRESCAGVVGAVTNLMRDEQYDEVLQALIAAREHGPFI